ncbi:hypothetical protein ACFOTA_09325 [Chitinophaga sp. GCM10012297]|uniref:Uncharacterized protein n=1 Tax=Chitinophaga chungangae TaxID=2821488 RepID=A0ABS3YCJ8_9BACT|nr:hypothetical protein [Chitinophaga chungangae]MBO9152403.1 hypothetical protein [Chitinophaga chungangae]
MQNRRRHAADITSNGIATIYDQFALEKSAITSANSFDVGGGVSFSLDPLSLGVEALHRSYVVEGDLRSQRVVGVLNYRLGKDLYLIEDPGAFRAELGFWQRTAGIPGISGRKQKPPRA